MVPPPTPLDCKFGKMSFCNITRPRNPITLGDTVSYTVKIEAPIDPDIIADVVLKGTTEIKGVSYDLNFPTVTKERCFEHTLEFTPTACGTVRVLIGFMPKGGRSEEAEYADVEWLEVKSALPAPAPMQPPMSRPILASPITTLQPSPPNPFSRTG